MTTLRDMFPDNVIRTSEEAYKAIVEHADNPSHGLQALALAAAYIITETVVDPNNPQQVATAQRIFTDLVNMVVKAKQRKPWQ